MEKRRIVIVGGGFAGVTCAKRLRRLLANDEVDCVLFNRENHFVFNPLLSDAVGSSLNPLDVVVPLRELLPNVNCRTEEVLSLDLDAHAIIFEAYDGKPRAISYDQLVIACGNVANLNILPGMADHTFPLKTIGDAVVLRAHVLRQLEKAEVCDDPVRKVWFLSFIVVGGGFSGVEVAGEINDLVNDSVRLFSTIRAQDVSVTLIHSQPQVLPEIGSRLRDFARMKMERAGVKVVLEKRVVLATAEGVRLNDGTFVSGATTVCTIGISTAPIIERLDAVKQRGRLVTGADMRLEGRGNVWAIGDAAHIVNAHDGLPSPPTAQFAERHGRQAAQNIAKVLHGKSPTAFRFKPLGQLCSIGGHCAVAELFGMQLSGLFAWFLWRGTYLLKMPSWARRLQVGFDWAWVLVFPRDLSHLKPTVTDRVSHAHYQAGDFIFAIGDAPMSLYVLERGQVDVLRRDADGGEQIIAVLNAGSFFGEQALVNDTPRTTSVRARTDVEVLVIGCHLFGQLSHSLAPLRNALARNIAAGAIELKNARPEVLHTLRNTAVAALLEPAPQPFLRPDATLREVSRTFAEHESDVLFVSSDGVRLDGVVSLTDLMNAYSAGMSQNSPVADVMTKNPVSITAEDTTLLAAELLLSHQLKVLPVLHRNDASLIGSLSTRRLMARAMAVPFASEGE